MAIHIKYMYIACFFLFPKYYYIISLFVQLLGSFFRIYILEIILTSNNYNRFISSYPLINGSCRDSWHIGVDRD